ncbi:GNAT family N-acetyltransferase [Halorarius halobius]|uniref:GNAT family N-acetyltransferase n=1 Tax=Halorarius halobius TaxID=2962671 RepID=UPI0020CCDCED|nr:GNAT family N-acetyltransferase [Halorarius halobius]
MRLRRATDADGDTLVTLHERALRDAGTDPADVPGTDDLRSVEASFFAEGGEFLVLEDEGEVVAMGGYRPADDATVELFRIAVAPARQREGLGDRIVDTLERRARVHGFERVVLETVIEQEAAAQFYPARGYEETHRGETESGNYTLLRFEKRL